MNQAMNAVTSMRSTENYWHKIPYQGLPDFRVYGFHTGKTVEVRQNGTQETKRVKYLGYGEFGGFGETLKNVTHWRP